MVVNIIRHWKPVGAKLATTVIGLLLACPAIAEEQPARSALPVVVSLTPEIQSLLQKAQAGNAAAQDQLGRAYMAEKGVTQDWTQSLLWIQKAASQNNADAQSALGWFYIQGRGLSSGPGHLEG